MLNILLQDPTEINHTVISQLLDKLLSQAMVIGEKLIIAAIVYVIGRWVISFLRKLIKKILFRKQVDGAVASFANSTFNILLKVMLLIVIVDILGIKLTSIAAILAAAGLAVGISMRDNLSNFAGGVMLLLNKPFKLGDYIIAQGLEGAVTGIGILYTVLLTSDGRTVYLPNGPLSTGNIINNSEQKNRRVDISFNINYGYDADELKAIFTEIINSNPLVLKDPLPFTGITAVKNGNFDITIRAWGLTSDYSVLCVQLNESIYKTMREKGIFVTIPLSVRLITEK